MAKKTNKKNIKEKKKKMRIKIHMIFLVLFFLVALIYSLYYLFNLPITNIYISGNEYFTDQEIIEMAKISSYPKWVTNSSMTIKERLEKNVLINKVTITKRFFTRVYIEIDENRPLLFNSLTNRTILKNGEQVTELYDVPTLINELPDYLYKQLLTKLAKTDTSIHRKMSEIKYDPDEVDEERLLLTMTDGNYAYVAISKFELINDYNEMLKEFTGIQGILYLNAGGYFKTMESQ